MTRTWFSKIVGFWAEGVKPPSFRDVFFHRLIETILLVIPGVFFYTYFGANGLMWCALTGAVIIVVSQHTAAILIKNAVLEGRMRTQESIRYSVSSEHRLHKAQMACWIACTVVSVLTVLVSSGIVSNEGLSSPRPVLTYPSPTPAPLSSPPRTLIVPSTENYFVTLLKLQKQAQEAYSTNDIDYQHKINDYLTQGTYWQSTRPELSDKINREVSAMLDSQNPGYPAMASVARDIDPINPPYVLVAQDRVWRKYGFGPRHVYPLPLK